MESNTILFSQILLAATGGTIGIVVGELFQKVRRWDRVSDVLLGVWLLVLTIYLVDWVSH